MSYIAPISAIAFTLDHIADLSVDVTDGLHGELTADIQASILTEAGKFAVDNLAPLNRQGDLVGARFADGVVTMPTGWREVFAQWSAAGWNSVDLPSEWGGMGLPTRLAAACMELWTSACMSFALCPVLGQGATDALHKHGSTPLKTAWLPKLVSGEWTATMNLTEPQAGSDLGALRTLAVPRGDGTYLITGSKCFISYGEHDLTDNIVHFVLARLPDAPQGTRGISLFLVPKILPGGTRNDVRCVGVEHKLGIHASPTCTMVFGESGGAVGWLIGTEHHGLACMFTMMNKARLYTGLQGVAIAERAYQQAMAYAKQRRQGRAIGSADISPIIAHPDVRRNLMTMKALIWAGRAIAYNAAAAIDRARSKTDPAADELAGLLTPITKAFCSEIGVEVTSLGIQIHGGAGYVEETGAAQHFRDARIVPIYEGTNGIQAIDLVMRKVLRPESTCAATTIEMLRSIGVSAQNRRDSDLHAVGAIVVESADALGQATDWLREKDRTPDELLTVASPYLRLFGITAGAGFLLKGAIAASDRLTNGDCDPIYRDAIATTGFYANTIALMASALARIITADRGPQAAKLPADFLI
jgi:acyl-CoA dehydrogenase